VGSAVSGDVEVPAIVRRFPALAWLPRAALGRYPTPVVSAGELAPDLWVKRDDLDAEPLGGNKVRSLEFLLGGVGPGSHVLTVGPTGSTHALATAVYAKQLGARVSVFRWPQESSRVARQVAARTVAVADRVVDMRTIASVYVRAAVARLRGAHWVPAGGSVPLGILGHVNAALELAEQVARHDAPLPRRVIVPLGSGGTAAGLLAGFVLAGLDVELIGARVVPRIVANRRRVIGLARRTLALIALRTGERTTFPPAPRFRIVHDVYGGAYARETPEGRDAAARFARWAGTTLDATYSAKALVAALHASGAGGPTLYWLTFDGHWLSPDNG
jgi:1-aminocyclopropane-1-carboxylate deaminase/D-cysteine desulfhydrase-like pyridoxal-dependent ACC family enzyme